MKTNIKMRITPEQSKKVQEIVFANGGRWIASGKNIVTKEKIYGIHIPKDLVEGMYCSIDSYNFNEETRLEEEVDADLFIRTNGTCEETKTPKYPHFKKMLNNMNENFAEAIKMVEKNEEKELENAKYKVGDFLKGDEKHNDFFIKILEVKYSLESENIVYLVKNVKDGKQYSFGERHLYNHFKLQKNENSKYKIGDILKGISGIYENFFIEIKQVSISETGAIYYNTNDIENEKQYTYTERYLEQHFELKTDETNATNPNHYNKMKIQPNEYITANQNCFSWYTANVIKYVSRYKSKNGIEDLEKAIKCLQFEIEELKKVEQ